MKWFASIAPLAGVALALSFDGRDLVRIEFTEAGAFDAFISLPGFDRENDFEAISQEYVLVWTTENTRSQLSRAGFVFSFAEDPSVPAPSSAVNYKYVQGEQNWREYCDHSCLTERLRDISEECDYPLESIGNTVQGREIWVMTVGEGSPTVLLAANIHGDETTGGQLLQRFLWETCFNPSSEQVALAERYTTAYMPMMNPDGYESNRRNNANNRDLNRDFPIPGQTPNRNRQIETLAYMDYVAAHPSLRTSIMYHGEG